MNGKDAGHTLDHHLADVVLVFANKSDAGATVGRHRPHPFGAGAGLAGAAAAEDQPGAPVGNELTLMIVREGAPIDAEVFNPLRILEGERFLQEPEQR